MTYDLHFAGQLVEQFDTKAEAEAYREIAMAGWANMSDEERATALDWPDTSLQAIRDEYIIAYPPPASRAELFDHP